MARLARVVAGGYPHHVTQRGTRRMPTFFSNDDYEAYRALVAEWCAKHTIEIWAYCLMPNHVHLTALPYYAWANREQGAMTVWIDEAAVTASPSAK